MKQTYSRKTITEYRIFTYENKEEKKKHWLNMLSKGWTRGEFLTGLKEDEVCFSKMRDVK